MQGTRKVLNEIVTRESGDRRRDPVGAGTQDKNIGFIAEYLTNIGIDLKEVRVVADDEADIIAALDALRHRYTYVFTTGGIGPTHDDITADSVAKAFGVGIDHHPEVVARFASAGARAIERGAAAHGADSRRRRADPERHDPGARLQDRQCHRDGRRALDHAGDDGHRRAEAEIGGADAVRTRSAPMQGKATSAVRCARIANAHPDTIIGSYPFLDEDKKPNTNLVVARAIPTNSCRDECGKGDAGGIERGP
jgi:hypothetical protein